MAQAEFHNLSIIRQTKGRIPVLPFVDIKEAILGRDYELSLVFPTNSHSRELHKTWKKKSNPVNILSFPLDEHSGEIILTLGQARREARRYGRSYQHHLIFLFIHGCLHLKGMTHGAKMEQQERLYYEQFVCS